MVALGFSEFSLSEFLRTIIPLPRGVRVVFIALSKAPQPLDQTDLDRWPRLLLKGGGGRIHEVETDWP